MSKIVVVGGGAAGLLCAAKSAEKGNDVIIIEKINSRKKAYDYRQGQMQCHKCKL